MGVTGWEEGGWVEVRVRGRGEGKWRGGTCACMVVREGRVTKRGRGLKGSQVMASKYVEHLLPGFLLVCTDLWHAGDGEGERGGTEANGRRVERERDGKGKAKRGHREIRSIGSVT